MPRRYETVRPMSLFALCAFGGESLNQQLSEVRHGQFIHIPALSFVVIAAFALSACDNGETPAKRRPVWTRRLKGHDLQVSGAITRGMRDILLQRIIAQSKSSPGYPQQSESSRCLQPSR
jgi:hypothetical protein